MNDYSKLGNAFSQYKDNENLIIINDFSIETISNVIEVYIVDKNNLRINRPIRNILYYELFTFKEKKKYEKLHSEIIEYIKSKYNIENLYDSYSGGVLYCSKKIYNMLIKAASLAMPVNNSLNLSIVFKHDILNLLFNFKIPYNKIKFWLKNNYKSLEYKISILSIIYNSYNNEINKVENEKRKIEEKLNNVKFHKDMFLQCIDDETKLLLEISK